MRFAWNRATAEQPATDEPIAAAISPADGELALGGIELLTVAGRRIGWIATGGQRTSDWLNARSDVPLLGCSAGDVELSPEPPRTPMAETTLPRDQILWVVPPALPPNRHLRLHRRRMLVHLELDDYNVSGQIHVRPGASAVDQVLRGARELVPLTEVQVVSRSGPNEGFVVPVLLVNRIHVRRVVEDSAHVSGAVPEPIRSLPPGAELDPRIAWLVPDPPAEVDPEPEPEPAPAGALAAADAVEEPSGLDMLRSAAEILLETGIIDVVEYQSIRARIPSPPAE